MGVSTSISLVLALLSALFLFSGMRMYLTWFTSSNLHTILGGYLGSLLFVCLLTALGNLEAIVFGNTFQLKIFPEVTFCLLIAFAAAAFVHGISATTCLLFSIIQLYYIGLYSQKVYITATVGETTSLGKKKK